MKKIIVRGLVLLYFPVIFSFVAVEKSNLVCSSFQTVIRDSVDSKFVSGADMRALLLKSYPDLLGRPVDEIDCEAVEKTFNKYPSIERCEAFVTCSGALCLNIQQRVPKVRVYGGSGSYYLDENGRKMPLSSRYTAHVIVAGGYLGQLDSLSQLVTLAEWIEKDDFWQAQIEQIYVEEHGEFILVPRVGDHVIELGNLEFLEEKFNNLHALYTKGWELREWNLYEKVSLKYKGQVVCTKR